MNRVSYINLILGAWLVASPVVLGSSATDRIAAANDVSLGVLLIALSWWLLAARTAHLYMSGCQLLCGAWLIAAPFVLTYRGFYATLNDAIVGAVVVIVSLFEAWGLVRPPMKAA
jgi:hypothetical protein